MKPSINKPTRLFAWKHGDSDMILTGTMLAPALGDPIRISVPKGSYVPRFDINPYADDGAQNRIASRGLFGHRWLKAGLVFLGLFVLGFVGWLLSFTNTNTDRQNASQSFPTGPVLAVLPIEMIGDGPQYIAKGLTHQLTTELVRFDDLWVLPLGSVMRFRDGQTDFQALTEEFDAEFALEGTVTIFPDGLNISARLIDLNNARYIWVTSLDSGSDPAEIYEAQNTITREVLGNLAGRYGLLSQSSTTTARRRPPESHDAYDCVLQYYDYQISISLERYDDVLACMEESVRLDPEFAEAWAILSNLYLQQIRFGLGGDRMASIQAAEKSARRSVELDPHSAFGQLMLANMLHTIGDFQGFKIAGQKAIELNPNDAAVLGHYGLRLAFIGEWEEGLQIVDKAIRLNPVHPHWYFLPKIFHDYLNGNYEDALGTLDNMDMPSLFWVPLCRAALQGQLGNKPEAEAAVKEVLRLKPNISTEAVDLLNIWHFEEPLNKKFIEGLRKAGLDIIE